VTPPDFQVLFRWVPGWYLVLEPDLTIVAASDAYLRATRTIREEIIGRGLFDVYSGPAEVPSTGGVSGLRASLEKVLRDRAPDRLVVARSDLLRSDPEAAASADRSWDLSNSPAFDDSGNLTHILHQVEDVTELVRLRELVATRREGERGLRESEGRFRAFADSMAPMAWMARPDGSISWYNRRWYDYTGTTSEQMAAQGWQSVHDPAVRLVMVEPWEEAIAGGEPFQMVVPIRGADGQFRAFATDVQPMRDEAGRIAGWCGTQTDISEQREMAQRLREHDRRKDEFLAMLAHELRNPLAAISNATQVLKRTDQPEHREWGRGIIEANVTHLARMIDDLLDVSRVTRGRIQLRKQRLNVVTLVNSAVETVRPLVEERKHRLTVSLETAPMLVEGDPTRLEQILVNLLNNAAKYTESGGRITLTAQAEPEEIVIHVEDNGIGMSPELLARAFDLFAQGDRSIARSEGGLGIGLTLVKSLAEMHGGRIEATSDGPGRGSRFTVRLPAFRPAADAPESQGLPGSGKRGSRVLVVDDNVDTARGMERLLKLLDHEVRVAYDGPAALAQAREHRPDVILLDIGLPGISGYQVAETLRAEGFHDTLIIAITGYGEEQAMHRSRESGFNHHLVKPVDFDSLLALIGRPH
jgi:PAS domain S-box-containing protein